MIWWMYDGYVWLTNSALDVLGHRFLLLGGMAGFLIMALAIPTTFDGGGLAFGLGYLVVVLLHAWLYLRETSPSESEAMRGIVPFNLAGALLLVVAGLADGDWKWALLLTASALFWVTPHLARLEGFVVAVPHFVERHGLVVIVALGESIVVLGVGAGGAEVGLELAVIAVLGLAVAAALWWTYFSHEDEVERALFATPPAQRPGRAIKIGYAHFVLLLGVVFLAAGLKKAIPDPFGDLTWETATTLALGSAMFVAADTVMLRLLGVAHGLGRVLAVVGVVATIPIGLVSASAQVAAIVAVLVLGLLSDRLRPGYG